MLLSKKHRRKQQSTKSPQIPLQILFTLPTIRMLKDALRLMEARLRRSCEPLPNLELAVETVEGLKTKLDNMMQGEKWGKETELDYNELHILYAAIHMYLVELRIAGNNNMITPCLRLCKQFSLIVEQIKQIRLNVLGDISQ